MFIKARTTFLTVKTPDLSGFTEQKLTIQGFKSYRDQVVVDPFSQGVNVVVGRNGSGKSNFFSGKFVLGDAYTSLSREARQALLHEGVATTSTFSAYVEIVFDNSDSRFPTGKDEVVLRRTVGAKKDEYSLDRKSTGKGEIMSLLESAGFSKANPYYIVPQGRITHLTNQKDPERLELLKEVAGTKVYEDRRAEALKNIQEAETKRTKVEELLEVIDERLAELEEEKEELKEFSSKDKERRCLEYSIYQRELSEVTNKLNEIEEERANIINTANESRGAFQARQREIVAAEGQLSERRQELDLLQVDKSQAVSDRQEAIKAKTQVECLVRDLSEASTSTTSKRQALESELAGVQASIAEKEQKLSDDITPQLSTIYDQLKRLQTQLADATATSDALYAKQGRTTQFSTQQQRDNYLHNEMHALETRIHARDTKAQETRGFVKQSKANIEQLEKELRDVSSNVDGRKAALQELQDEVTLANAQSHDFGEQRKEMWKEEQRLITTRRHAQDQVNDAQSQLGRAMDRNTSSGLQAIDRLVQHHNLGGVYGPLYKLFTVPEVYRQATEVTAGTSLFHVVVDNDATATKVLELMKREKAGRVTFMPLNRLKPKEVQYPQDDSVQPLLRKLRFDPIHEKALQQVFSKTLVCENLHSATTAMNRYGMNVITLDGDKVDRKGALSGGFHDVRRSRLQAAEQLQRWSTTLSTENNRLAEVRRTLVKLDQQVTQSLSRKMQAETKLAKLQDGRAPILASATTLREDLGREEARLQRLEKALQSIDNDISGSKTQLEALREEIQQPMVQSLSAEEMDTLTDLSKTIERTKSDLAMLSKERTSLETSRQDLEIQLNESLRRKADELRSRLETLSASHGESEDSSPAELEARQSEVLTLEKSVSRHTEKMTELEGQIDETQQAVQKLQAELEKLQGQQAEDAKGISRQSKGTERYHSKKSMLESRKEETEGHIRDLGVLPEEAFEKYTDFNSDQLVSKLHNVNDALKKFTGVNKKAVEQFSNFATQKEELEERREELDKSSESIEELLDTLDMRKEEAIERTFKQVSKSFSEVFERLVPSGRGRLIMLKALDGDSVGQDTVEEEEETDGTAMDEDEEDEDAPRRRGKKRRVEKGKEPSKKNKKSNQGSSKISNYTGVAIRVSFNSKVDEGLHIQQLSGGQKSLVALALVFAIQKCDPAPFYLFDEIDANLDADRRTAIAAMIKELSEKAQFIITTFRAELLSHADHFFGVIFDARKVSTVKQISQQDCMTFVEHNEKAI